MKTLIKWHEGEPLVIVGDLSKSELKEYYKLGYKRIYTDVSKKFNKKKK